MQQLLQLIEKYGKAERLYGNYVILIGPEEDKKDKKIKAEKLFEIIEKQIRMLDHIDTLVKLYINMIENSKD